MTPKLTEAIEKEVDDIVRVTETLARDAAAASDKELGPTRVAELRGAATRLAHVVRMVVGHSAHLVEVERLQAFKGFAIMHADHCHHVAELAGVAIAVQHQLRAGLLGNVQGLIQAELFDDFLEMAEHLLAEGYKDPAAVIAGAVLEDTLRKRLERENLPTVDAEGKNLLLEALNVALKKAGVYTTLVQKQVTAWGDLRNKAAHAKWNEYDAGDVKLMLAGVRKICTDYLL